MESRLWLDRLAQMLVKTNDTSGLNDTCFPTLNPDAPGELTKEEAEIIKDLEYQFINNRRLKRLLRYFFTYGETYNIHNNVLNIHALVPSTADGEFEEFLGRKGKDSLILFRIPSNAWAITTWKENRRNPGTRPSSFISGADRNHPSSANTR